MRSPKIHAPHLAKPRPVPASRAVGGTIRLVVLEDRVGARWLSVAAGVMGVVTAVTLAVGVAVIS